jgi:hypothetical protein
VLEQTVSGVGRETHATADRELKYKTLWEKRNAVVAGWREPLSRDYEWLEKEQQELEDTLQREGRRLMKTIPSLTSPALSSLPPPESFFRNW